MPPEAIAVIGVGLTGLITLFLNLVAGALGLFGINCFAQEGGLIFL